MIVSRLVTKLPLAANALKLLSYYDNTVIWQFNGLDTSLSGPDNGIINRGEL